ncbi:Rho GTPase-activating protein RGD1 [Entomortierella parvispora]|uniref:Rho GTPase-activating protein RGD1 n=1 Tax=Entomortierella parvispora TaxID=205924 RepID=A0A9P3LWF7_9FUNG|nr:Rho GTPase-activating protein RGD1 [Entomortierella parvispora]
MLRSAQEKAERRASKTQSLYVATPSTLSALPPQQLQSFQPSFPGQLQGSNTVNSPLSNSTTNNNSSTPKSPRKSRPFSMMFLHPQDELARQQQQQEGLQQQQQPLEYQQPLHQQPLNESDEDAATGDGQSLTSTVIDYGESDLKDADSDTRMLIAHLSDLDSGLPILLERVKQNLHSCKDLVSFLKKRSVMEAEHGTSILKLASGLRDSYRQQSEGTHAPFKQGSYGDCWNHILEMHERMGTNRLELSRDLHVISEELSTIYKETDRSRKQFKEAGAKQERLVQEQEQNLEKAKQKYDSLTEEWEKAILHKAADPTIPKKGTTKGMSMNIFKQPKSAGQLHRQEEEARLKAASSHEQYKLQLARTNDARQYYYSHTLPSILKNLKDTIDESDLSLQYYLMRYGYMSEDYMMKDATIMSPFQGPELGLRDRVELINKDTDLQVFIQASSAKATPIVKDPAPYEEFVMSTLAQSIVNPRPIFGCDLAEQLNRDERELPEILVKCSMAIEQFGIDSKGIYRVSGITSATNRLRSSFDRDCAAVDLSTEESCGDINSVASVLKAWFRELPEPLLTRKLYPEFVRIAGIQDETEKLTSLHLCTNSLPDPNYATLKFLMCHLNRIQANQKVNAMGPTNLGLIFGATLAGSDGDPSDTAGLARMSVQSNIVETLLINYNQIFGDEGEEEEEEVGPVDHDTQPGGDAMGYQGHDYDYDEQQLHNGYEDQEHDDHYEQFEHGHAPPDEYHDNGSEPVSAVEQRFEGIRLHDGPPRVDEDEFGIPQDHAQHIHQQEQQEQGGVPYS